MKLNRKLIRKMILKEMADLGIGMPPERPMVNPQVISAARDIVGMLKYLLSKRLAAPGTAELAIKLDSMTHKYNSGQLPPQEFLRFLNSPDGMPVQRSPQVDSKFNKLKIILQNSL